MVCYLGQQGLSRYHLTFKLHTVSIDEDGGGGYGRSHFSDGFVSDTAYKPGDIKHLTFKEGEFMVHDLENIGDTELLFTTVEFLESPNAPLELRSRTSCAAVRDQPPTSKAAAGHSTS